MLAAAQRLRRRGEFAATIRAGRRVGRGAVVVHLSSPDPGTALGTAAQDEAMMIDNGPVPAGSNALPARAGFVVSKAVGGAVTRNKVKRRLRELMRERLVGLPAGTDVVVRAQASAAAARYPRLAEDLDAALAAALRPRRPGGRDRERGRE